MDVKYLLNWKPSPEDKRDYKFADSFRIQSRATLPTNASVESIIPEVYDQADIGSCVFNSTGSSILYNSRLQNRETFPSRLFFYYITREFEGSVDCDCGAYIRDAFKMLNKQGVCTEKTWPYITDRFTNKPSPQAYKEAPETIGVTYHALDNTNLNELKTCIAVLKKPFVLGFNVYSSFTSGNWDTTTGMMPIPNKKKEQLLGGHAVLCVGFDDSKQAFKIRNSWSKSWGLDGDFWMPYSFITSNECDDFWILESINDSSPKPIDSSLDISKVFTTKRELNLLPESLIVKIGQLLTLDVNMIYTKKKNLDTVANFLNLK